MVYKRFLVTILILALLIGGAFLIFNRNKKHISNYSLLPKATTCNNIIINRLNDLTTNNGTFKDLNNSWEIGPKGNIGNVSQVFPLAYYSTCDLETGEVRVDFQLIGGQEDKYAGLVFGLTTPGDYYVVRASGSENSIMIAQFRNGSRTVLKTFDRQVTTNAWHTLKVTIDTTTITIFLDNKAVAEGFPLQAVQGKVGVNTKSDSITQFKNLQLVLSNGVMVPKTTPTPTTQPSPTIDTANSINDGIDTAVGKITSALKAGNASQFQDLLVNGDIVLGGSSNGNASTTVNKADAISWLNQHWSNNMQYVSKNYVQHFGYWEIETSGWSNVSSGRVFFRLFKYDAQGSRTIGDGNWMIYAVLY